MIEMPRTAGYDPDPYDPEADEPAELLCVAPRMAKRPPEPYQAPVIVCAACGKASCWDGVLMCEESATAGATTAALYARDPRRA